MSYSEVDGWNAPVAFLDQDWWLMETVEIIVYMAIALIVGALLISFLGGIKGDNIYKATKNLFLGNEASYKKITPEDFPGEVVRLWDSCGQGGLNKSIVLFVQKSNNKDEISKVGLFRTIKKYNLCKTLQWSDMNCGVYDDVNFINQQVIKLPRVIRLSCNTTTEQLDIIGAPECPDNSEVCADIDGKDITMRVCDLPEGITYESGACQ